MGYSLYLRRQRPIEAEELLHLAEVRDGALVYREIVLWPEQGQLEYRGGREEDVPLLLELAGKLGARLVGDDGEVYPLAPGEGVGQGPNLWNRAREWLAGRTPPKNSPYQVGDRVKDIISGRQGTVIGLLGGTLPKVRVRYDDGRETLRALEASGLDKL